MRKIQALELGGTLFIPANHKNLLPIVSGEKYPNLKSLVVDTEDSIKEESLDESLLCIKNMLDTFGTSDVFVFIRPRNTEVLKTLLSYKNIDKIDGFILPKFSLLNADSYLKILQDTSFSFMPSIEGEELFDTKKLYELKEKLLDFKEQIILVRFGLEDMLRQLAMRRKCEDSIFDFSVTSSVIGNFLSIFKADAFSVSGGVYPCFDDEEGFKKDVCQDLKEGVISKTIIHPRQIELFNECYKVDKNEYLESKEIVESSKAVFNQNGKMAETTTMFPFAKEILKRADIYGVRD